MWYFFAFFRAVLCKALVGVSLERTDWRNTKEAGRVGWPD